MVGTAIVLRGLPSRPASAPPANGSGAAAAPGHEDTPEACICQRSFYEDITPERCLLSRQTDNERHSASLADLQPLVSHDLLKTDLHSGR